MLDDVAIVSGAARGMGNGFAEKLASEGYKVLAFDLDKAVENIKGVQAMVADVS